MSGPLEREFARLHARLAPGWKGNHADPHEDELDRAALSSIERHVQDMETALMRLVEWSDRWPSHRVYGGEAIKRVAAEIDEVLALARAILEPPEEDHDCDLPETLTEIYGTKADRDGDRRHYAPDARREEETNG